MKSLLPRAIFDFFRTFKQAVTCIHPDAAALDKLLCQALCHCHNGSLRGKSCRRSRLHMSTSSQKLCTSFLATLPYISMPFRALQYFDTLSRVGFAQPCWETCCRCCVVPIKACCRVELFSSPLCRRSQGWLGLASLPGWMLSANNQELFS